METKENRRTGRKPSGGASTRKRTGENREKTTAPRPKRRSVRPSADVMYTQPGPFNRNRFLLHLASVVAVVLALLFGISIFFKVDTVTVSGNVKYTQWDVYEASGIRKGENLLTLSKARYCSNIRSKLPYVDTVRMGVKLPGTVKIEITELDVVYSVEDENGAWWVMSADGIVVEKISAAEASQYTMVQGVKITGATVGETATAAIPVSQETLPDGTPVPVTVDTARQLNVAVSVMQYLEESGLIGSFESINVTDTDNIELWYGKQYQVLLGDATELSRKLRLIKTAIETEMQTYDSGVLDVSFRVKPDPDRNHDIIFTPFPEGN